MELCDVVERLEAEGAKVLLRYGGYPDSEYSDLLDASVESGSIRLSVTTERLALGSRLTAEHERAVAQMLAPVVGFFAAVANFSLQDARQSGRLVRNASVERLMHAGVSEIRLGTYGANHCDWDWVAADFELRGAHYRMDTRAHGEAALSEHEFVMDWHLNGFAASLAQIANLS